jgi:Undecaprenyl-phosphate glucose phosphotransferase
VGSGPVADRLVNHLELVSQGMTQIVGIFDDRAERVPENSLRPCGSISDLVELGRERQIDWIIVTLPWSAEKRLLAILRELKNLAVDVALCPQQIGLQLPHRKVEYMGDLPVMLIADRPLRRWAFVLKQMEDKILGGLITLATLPLMGLVALAIRLDSPGPIIFRQWRHGWNNSEFEVYKFRTMRHDKAQPGVMRQTARNDSRITRVGGFLRRTSLDELPQLFNVLKGDMSLVGPRPHPTVMRTEEQLGHEIVDEYAHRHRVKPGITGWAQVNGLRGATMNAYQLQKRIEYDLYYIENWSLLLDFKILLMTSLKVMSDKNAF